MSLESTPKANRLHIGFFGRCNAGKSTLINMLTGQPISLVSEIPGTTTDPVTKSMEILPLGPVTVVDTAGVDDTSELGQLRVTRTKQLLPQMNMAVYVLNTNEAPQAVDLEWLSVLRSHKLNVLLFINEVNGQSADAYVSDNEVLEQFGFPYEHADVSKVERRTTILETLGKMKPTDEEEQALLEGIVTAGDIVVLVCPIDSAAPKGRLILPQVQMLREVLDRKGLAMVVQTDELSLCLQNLATPPRIVITDSQAFEEVSAIVPNTIPLTSFSILMARFKGELKDLVNGVQALKNLKNDSKVLISEGCTHHRQCDDIGTVKIPRWLHKAGYTNINLSWTSGGAFPENVEEYDLVIHCGACMLTRREVLRRIEAASIKGVPIVNYGVLIASLHGILERALSPFKDEIK